jgi:hypothetical protein
MANRPWTPEGEEELLELRASGVPLRLVAGDPEATQRLSRIQQTAFVRTPM